jgi:hypothetical protein
VPLTAPGLPYSFGINWGFSMGGRTTTTFNTCDGSENSSGCSLLSFSISAEGCVGPRWIRACIEAGGQISGELCDGNETWEYGLFANLNVCTFSACTSMPLYP